VYMSEAMRVSLTPDIGHMSLWAIYGGLIGFATVLTWLGVTGFIKRVRT
jgi:ABC-2 type transport system permease protein